MNQNESINEHPRFSELRELQNKYKHRMTIEGDLESLHNLIKLACFKNDKRVTEWSSFRISDDHYIVFFNRNS